MQTYIYTNYAYINIYLYCLFPIVALSPFSYSSCAQRCTAIILWVEHHSIEEIDGMIINGHFSNGIQAVLTSAYHISIYNTLGICVLSVASNMVSILGQIQSILMTQIPEYWTVWKSKWRFRDNIHVLLK